MTVETETEAPQHCARHPRVESYLRCGRCDTPICPRCMVTTPVGARCPTCANVHRFALNARPSDLAAGFVVGLLVATFGGAIVQAIPFLAFIGTAILGFGVGEVVLRMANRRRSAELGWVALAAFVIGVLVSPALTVFLYPGATIGLVPVILVQRIAVVSRSLTYLAMLFVGGLLAWMRAR